jgi:hypothetical protein
MANTINLSNTTPAASAGNVNVTWQNDSSTPPNISGYVPGMTSMPLSPITIFGSAVYGSTVAPGANHLLHLRLTCYRNSTGTAIVLWMGNAANKGFYWGAQSDGNLVVYGYNGSSASALLASGGSWDDSVGPVMIELFMGITATGASGVTIGGRWFGMTKGFQMFSGTGITNNAPFGMLLKNTSYDMTGTLSIGASADSLASIYTLQYEVI